MTSVFICFYKTNFIKSTSSSHEDELTLSSPQVGEFIIKSASGRSKITKSLSGRAHY